MNYIRVGNLLVILLIGSLIIAACDNEPTEEPPSIPAASRVTITLPPVFQTRTPLFTATLTPSSTYTPSDTPTASDTPTPITPSSTPTMTPTATLSGLVISTTAEGIRVREGPGSFDFPFITSLANDTVIGVLGQVTNDDGEIWYQISFINANNEVVIGWMRSDFVDIDPAIVPELTATSTAGVVEATASLEPTATFLTPPPFESATPVGTVEPSPTGSITPSALSAVNIRAAEGTRGCRDISNRVVTPTTAQSVSIFWSWWVTRSELMQDHVAAARYTVLLDGRSLEAAPSYRTEMQRDPVERNNWTVYWYVPVGQLSAGTHTLEYTLTWSSTVNDGIQDYGPDTVQTGTCTFTVVAAR